MPSPRAVYYGPDVSDSSDTHFGPSIVVGGIPQPGCQYEPSPDTECRLGKVPCSNEGFTCGGWVSVRMRVFAPQTHQNLSSRPFCAPQDPHCRVRGFPHCAQNFFPRGSRLCISNSASFASAARQMAMRGSWSGTVCEVPTISPPLPWFCRYGNCITPSACISSGPPVLLSLHDHPPVAPLNRPVPTLITVES